MLPRTKGEAVLEIELEYADSHLNIECEQSDQQAPKLYSPFPSK